MNVMMLMSVEKAATVKLLTNFHHLLLHHTYIANEGYELGSSSFKLCLFYLISNGTFLLNLSLKFEDHRIKNNKGAKLQSKY